MFDILISPLLWFVHNVVPFLIVITILVFIHELGHYLVGRWRGVGAKSFSIGFGPEIFGYTDSLGTRWKLSWIPLGGYVQFLGEAEKEQEKHQSTKGYYSACHPWEKIAILVAGPSANLLFAFVSLLFYFMLVGQPYILTEIGQVVDDSPASNAGIQVGDQISHLDQQPVKTFRQIIDYIGPRPDEPIKITLVRKDASMTVIAILEGKDKPLGGKAGFLGIGGSQIAYLDHTIVSASVASVKEVADVSANIVDVLAQIITGSRSTDELGGPIRIAELSSDSWKGGGISFLSFLVLISINLALINLLPIPPLDGGNIVLSLYEWLFGGLGLRQASFLLLRLGLLFIIVLMVLITYNDIARLISS